MQQLIELTHLSIDKDNNIFEDKILVGMNHIKFIAPYTNIHNGKQIKTTQIISGSKNVIYDIKESVEEIYQIINSKGS